MEIIPGTFYDSCHPESTFRTIEVIGANPSGDGSKIRCLAHFDDGGAPQVIKVWPATLLDGYHYKLRDADAYKVEPKLTRQEIHIFACRAAQDRTAAEVAKFAAGSDVYNPDFDTYLSDLIDGFRKALIAEGIE